MITVTTQENGRCIEVSGYDEDLHRNISNMIKSRLHEEGIKHIRVQIINSPTSFATHINVRSIMSDRTQTLTIVNTIVEYYNQLQETRNAARPTRPTRPRYTYDEIARF